MILIQGNQPSSVNMHVTGWFPALVKVITNRISHNFKLGFLYLVQQIFTALPLNLNWIMLSPQSETFQFKSCSICSCQCRCKKRWLRFWQEAKDLRTQWQ